MITISTRSFPNSYFHHDEYNNVVGTSNQSGLLIKEYVHIDMSGNVCGYSKLDLGGGFMHYDADMHYLGKSVKNPFGGYVHYLEDGEMAGTTVADLSNNLIHKNLKIKIF